MYARVNMKICMIAILQEIPIAYCLNEIYMYNLEMDICTFYFNYQLIMIYTCKQMLFFLEWKNVFDFTLNFNYRRTICDEIGKLQKKVIFLVVRPLGGGGKGRTTKGNRKKVFFSSPGT